MLNLGPDQRGATGAALALVLLAAAVLVTACTGGAPATPTAAPATAAPSAPSAAPSVQAATDEPETAPPTQAPTAATTPGTTATAAGSSACADLSASIPLLADGVAIGSGTVTLDMFSELDQAGYAAILASVNASEDDLTLVIAAGGETFEDQINIRAFCVTGAPGDTLVEGEIARLLSIMVAGTQATPRTLGGKNIVQVGVQDPDFPKFAQYVYNFGDRVWTVQAGREELAAAIIEQLP